MLTMLVRPTVQVFPLPAGVENYFAKPDHAYKIPEGFKTSIKTLDQCIDIDSLTKEIIYDYILFVISQFIKHLESEKRPILDGSYALHHHLTSKLKDIFNEYTHTHATAGCTPIPCRTDIDFLDRYYSSLDEISCEDFL